jgi:hypothetical protein
MFSLSKPARIEESVPGANTARSDLIMVYDRWSRADSSGFLKPLRASLGVLEDIDIVEDFENVYGLKDGALFFNEQIKERCMRTLRKKLEEHFVEARGALRSLETTHAHTESLLARYKDSGMDSGIILYVEGMSMSMKKLLQLRKYACDRIEQISSFTKEFEEIQFLLLILSESSEDYIPRRAADQVTHLFPMIPRNFEAVRAANGKDLFIK